MTTHAERLRPVQITVWVCNECGYWRQDESTGVHVAFIGKGHGVTHRLTKANYVLPGSARATADRRSPPGKAAR